MRTTMPSIRRLWTMYKKTALQEGLGRTRRDHVQVLTQNAFYFGSYSVLQALNHLLEHGHVEEMHRVIERHGRQIRAMRGRKPRLRH